MKDMANLKILYQHFRGVYVNHEEPHDDRLNLSQTLHRCANPFFKLKPALIGWTGGNQTFLIFSKLPAK
jgi:hypothetical protein